MIIWTLAWLAAGGRREVRAQWTAVPEQDGDEGGGGQRGMVLPGATTPSSTSGKAAISIGTIRACVL